MELSEELEKWYDLYGERIKPEFESKSWKFKSDMFALHLGLKELPEISLLRGGANCRALVDMIVEDYLKKDKMPDKKLVDEAGAHLSRLYLAAANVPKRATFK